MKILVLGTGGIGGFFGGFLQESGADITFLVRPKRKELLLKNKLEIFSPLGDLSLTPNLILSNELKPIYDVILVSCKTYDLDQAMHDLKGIKGKGIIIPFLNGFTHMKRLDLEFGSENVIGGVAHISSTINNHGAIEHFSEFKKITFGDRNKNRNNDLLTFYNTCKKAKFDVAISQDITADLWRKWVFISTVAGATTLFNCPLGEISNHEVGKKTLSDLYNECRSIAKFNGFTISDLETKNVLKNIMTPGSLIKASMLRDIEKKAPTEHEEIFGDLISEAEKFDFNCPILKSCYLRMKIYEDSLK